MIEKARREELSILSQLLRRKAHLIERLLDFIEALSILSQLLLNNYNASSRFDLSMIPFNSFSVASVITIDENSLYGHSLALSILSQLLPLACSRGCL